MGGTKSWMIRSFLICFIGNGILAASFLKSKDLLGEAPSPAALLVAAGVVTLILWLLLLSGGRGRARQAPREAAPAPMPEVGPSPEPAIQMLAALQREGRLVDFLQEDISSYEDGQIGAAVRNIHTGCKAALRELMEIRPVFQEQEGDSVTVPPGFDARAIRLTGNVTGDPPFRGILRHKGWQAEHIRLPQAADEKKKWILAPAEVEIE